MLGDRFRINEQKGTRESQRAVSEDVRARESGIYGNPALKYDAVPADNWDTDDDYEVAKMHDSESPSGVGQPGLRAVSHDHVNATWQVALSVKSADLTRLWIESNVLTPETTFVWSQHQQSWVSILTVPEICLAIEQTRTELVERRNRRALTVALRAQTAKLSAILARYSWRDLGARIGDLKARVRAPLMPLNFGRGRWFVTALFCLAAIAILLPRSTGSNPEVLAETQIFGPAQRATQPDRAESKGLDPNIIAVESLPLVGNAEPKSPRAYGLGPFDLNRARRVLDRAAQQTNRCTRSEVSGTVLVGFDPSGSVKDVTIGALNGDVTRPDCILGVFRTARIAPFSGPRMVVKKSFRARSS